jgi:hypothetical protein
MHRVPMYMKDWVVEIDDFAQRYGKGVLANSGTVSHNVAMQKAEQEYEKYRRKIVDELSNVERDFLEAIKQTQKTLEKK